MMMAAAIKKWTITNVWIALPILFLLYMSAAQATEEQTVQFTPPGGWRLAEQTELPPSVKVMVIGQGAHPFPPSLTLGTESYAGTLKQYMQCVKEINKKQGHSWKDLGTIETGAGTASLSQGDRKTEWGEVRMIHLILKKEGMVYILNAAALKEEFPRFYADFFKAFRSLNFN